MDVLKITSEISDVIKESDFKLNLKKNSIGRYIFLFFKYFKLIQQITKYLISLIEQFICSFIFNSLTII